MSNLHILYIEEKDTNIQLVTDYLSLPCITLTVVENPAKSIFHIQQLKPDIILLNLSITAVDGFFVLRALKINFITQHIPIVLISSNYVIGRGATTGRFGAESFIGEPITRPHLTGAINRFVASSS